MDMNKQTFLDNEKDHAVSTIIQFLFDTLNKGTIMSIDDQTYQITAVLVANDYHNKEIIKNVLLYNGKIIKDTAWQLHLQYFTQNFKAHLGG